MYNFRMIKQPRLEDSETIISPNDTIDLVSSEDDNNDKSKSNPITAIASKQQEYTNQLFCMVYLNIYYIICTKNN